MTELPLSLRKNLFKHPVASLALPAALLSASAAAQEPAGIDTIVVTAGGYEQKLVDAPASISVLSQADLELKQYVNLAEALRDIEGVDVSQATGKTGGLEISIRGLPSAYTLFLIDGRRQNNYGDATPNGFAETANNFIPPLSAIERIEVIRGPMSSLYGSDAVGGVVNIITRKAGDAWEASVGADHVLQEDSDYGASSTTHFYASGPLVNDLLGLAVRGRLMDRGASELKFADGSPVSRRGAGAVEGRNSSWGMRLTLTPGSRHEIWLDYEQGRQSYNNDACQLGTLDGFTGTEWAGCLSTTIQASGYRDRLRFNRDQFSISHRAELGDIYLENAATYKQTETIGRTVPGTIGTAWTGFPTIVAGQPRALESTDLILDSKLVAPLGNRHTLALGGQYLEAEVIDGLATEKFQQSYWAVFAEDELRILQTRLTLGGRYENHAAFGGHFNPRAYLTWSEHDNWTLKGGIARGYRAPTVNQLHDGINGAINQGRTITIGSPSLKPETSTNYEVGAYFDNLRDFDANVTLFRTDFKHLIGVGTPIPNCSALLNPNQPGCLDFGPGFSQESFAQGANIDEARSQGLEFAASWRLAADWTLGLNYTNIRTEQLGGIDDGSPTTNQPRHILQSRLDWDISPSLQLWLHGEYYSSRPRFPNQIGNLTASEQEVWRALGDLKSYEQFHLGATYQATDRVRFTATLYNLFDKDFLSCGVYTTAAGDTVCAARHFQIGRVPSGHTTIWGTSQDRRRLWLSVNVDF